YPEMDFRDKHGFYTGPRYVFSLRIRQTSDTSVTATLRGVTRAGDIAWERLQDCATTQTRFSSEYRQPGQSIGRAKSLKKNTRTSEKPVRGGRYEIASSEREERMKMRSDLVNDLNKVSE